MNTVLYNITGIQNKTCKTQIKNALDKIKGVQGIEVDPAQSTVRVDYNEPATQNEISDCIQHTGFKIEYH